MQQIKISIQSLTQQVQSLQDSVKILITKSSLKQQNKYECDVAIWLKHTVKLPQYIHNFTSNGFEELDVMEDIKDDDLKAIGIELLGHRMKIMKEIAKLSNQQTEGPTVDI